MTLNDYINSIATAITALPLEAIYNAPKDVLIEQLVEAYDTVGGERPIVPSVLRSMPDEMVREVYIQAKLIVMGVPREMLPDAIMITPSEEYFKIAFLPPRGIMEAIDAANALIAAGVLPDLPSVPAPDMLRDVQMVRGDKVEQLMRNEKRTERLPAPKTFGTTHES